MAAAQLKRTRREVLGAAVALPVVGAAIAENPLPPPAPPRHVLRWRRALAAFEAAEGEFGRFEAFCRSRPDEEQLGLEDGYGDRLDALYAALRRLMKAPAPDWAALARKVALCVDHEVATLAGGEECMAALKGDCARLAG